MKKTASVLKLILFQVQRIRVVTRTKTYIKTPISNLFLGLMRFALHHAQSTDALQPFISLKHYMQVIRVMLGAFHIVGCKGRWES